MTGLPDSDAEWPPKPHDLVIAAAAEGQVWWEGDPEKLAAYYGGKTGDNLAAGRVRRTWQAARAAWWGKQRQETSDPKRLHVPVAADICRVSAATLLSQPVTFTDPTGNVLLGERIDTILNTPETYSRMMVAAESASALSGVYGRIVWDQSVDDHTWIDWVDADRAVPDFRWGKLTAVTFWTELDSDDDRVVYRHLERYEKGVILHGLYRGTPEKLGTKVDLAAHTATEALAEVVDIGVDELFARYMPNHRPAPAWRGTPALKDLGRSDLTADVIHLMDAIDHTWSSWMNDLEIGRGRLVVSEDVLTLRGRGLGTGFDADRSIFTPVNNVISSDGSAQSLFEVAQFEIRVEEHQRTYMELLRRTVSRVGYSPITFGLQDEVAATATEVDAKERDTNATRSARIRLWHGLAELATIQLAVDAAVFKAAPAPTETITVDWPSMHQESDRQRAEAVQLWEQARAASVETKVAMLHPDWDDERVDAEVAAINDENSLPVSIMGPGESNFGDQADDEQPAEDDTEASKPSDDGKPGIPAGLK